MTNIIKKLTKRLKLLSISVVVTMALFVVSADAKTPPPGVAGSNVAANIMLMLDTSGSMGWAVGAQIDYPVDVDYDSLGNMYVGTRYDGIMKFDSSGNLLLNWGTDYGDDDGEIKYIYSLELDSNDNVYVADQGNGRVQKFDSNGNYLDQFDVQTSYIRGLSIDNNDNVYAVNTNGNVEKFDTGGNRVDTWSNSGAYYLDAADDGFVYVANYGSKKIEKYDSNGNLQLSYSLSFYPYGVVVDSAGNIYAGEYSWTGKVYGYDASGSSIGTWSGFRYPRGLGLDNSGQVVVSDYYNSRVVYLDGTVLVQQESRLDQMKTVIKAIVSDSDLTTGANFGLLTWNSSGTANVDVDISTTGASEIYNMIDGVTAGGGTYLGSAMDEAENYWLGGSSPIVSGATCQQNINIVISDGEWFDDPDSTAADLLSNNGISTFTVGFLTTGNSNYTSLSQAGGTYPDSPLFAENYQNLIDILSNYIQQIINSSLTFTAPTIVPGIENNDHILQSTFNYRSNHQWKGHLFKYGLDASGLISGLIWDSGVQLNATSAANRQLWTIANGLATGLNNFVDTNFDELRSSLEENVGTSYTNQEIMDLVNFIRGEDIYNEYPTGIDEDGITLMAGERWKLADIYHSRASVVGPPDAFASDAANVNSETYYRYANGYKTFKTTTLCGSLCSAREEMIYVGSNGGMLHAIQSTDGNEKWGFIPPSALPNLREVISTTAAESNAIYGVDGSPAIKDIYYGGQWRTVLIGGLRQGGHSYFALDVTNPDAPAHLFTFSYNTTSNKVHYWAADGTETSYTVGVDTIPAEYDYSDLGEAWSDPLIIKAPVGTLGADKWVALIGGGFNNGINPNYGSRLFVIDLEDGGKIINKLIITDNDGGNGIENSVPPRVTAITADSTTLMSNKGALVYFTDLEGNLWKVNLTDNGTLYDATAQFDNEADTSNARFTYFGPEASITNSGVLINVYGTGDAQNLGQISGTMQNRAYGIFDRLFPSETVIPQFTASTLQDVTLPATDCPYDSQNGWLLDMDANEKVTARITVKNGLVFIPRFTPDAASVCSAGSGRITEHDLDCGGTISDTDLGEGMPTEAVVYKNKIYIGISNSDENTSLPPGFTKSGNLIVGTPSIITTGNVKIESWWEEF